MILSCNPIHRPRATGGNDYGQSFYRFLTAIQDRKVFNLFFKKARKDIKGYFIGVFDFAVDVILV